MFIITSINRKLHNCQFNINSFLNQIQNYIFNCKLHYKMSNNFIKYPINYQKNYSQNNQSDAKRNIIMNKFNGTETLWNFSSIDQKECKIDCVLIQNNILINMPWLKKCIQNTQNIVLADGGANIFHQNQLGNHEKIKVIIGDLDSLKPEIKNFYQQKNVEIIKIQDQNRNDFEKAVEWIAEKGYNSIFAFGSFGGRLDHTLATISNSQKVIKTYENLELVLLGKTNMMCVLRGGVKHRIRIPLDIKKQGCGIISFNKILRIETTGFKWNLGKEHAEQSLEWGRFISTSNQILGDQVTIQTFEKQNQLKFVVSFVNQG